MSDIRWRSPDEMKAFIEGKDNVTAVILVMNKDESYDTILVFKEGPSAWVDGPLMDFSCKEFNPFKYLMLAIVAFQEE